MAPPKKIAQSRGQTKLSAFFTPQAKPAASSETPRAAEKRPIDDDNCDDIWDSPIKQPNSAIPAKRKRIIESDDEEENVAANDSLPTTPKTTTSSRAPFTPQSQNSTSKSPRGTAGQISRSYIHSFRYDESDASGFDGRSSTATTPSRTPAKKNKPTNDGNDEEEGIMLHLTFEFLKPGKVKDSHGRLESDPEYDPRTLFVPAAFMQKQSPGHQQWWTFKSQNFNTVLFHKVGKFYEMYHMDAVVGVENLNLAYMRGKYAHCGFPEMAFGNFAEKLVRKGYKVARIEQTETPDQLEERCKTQKTKDKVVRRELCRIITQATQTYSSFDSPSEDGAVNTGAADSTYLLSICEKKNLEDGTTKTRYGVSFVDCATGQFYLCGFVDDTSFSTLRTLLAHNQPTQILQPRNGLSQLTQAVISSILGPVQKEELQQKREFLSASETLKLLLDNDYLGPNIREWPEALVGLVANPDEAIPKAKPEHELALNALGAILWYLRKCLIDVDLVTMRKFEFYMPTTVFQKNSAGTDRWTGRRMILDGFALKSLHLLPPNDLLSRTRTNLSSLDGQQFSLFNTINRCFTRFGRRKLRQWVCAPSCDPKVLRERQEAIQFLYNPENKDLMEFGKDLLNKIPDLERLFQRIHTLGLKYRSEKHPDSRAHFFETARYNSRKVKDLCVTLAGLEQLQKLIAFFDKHYKNDENCPPLLKICLGNKYTDMRADLEHFNTLVPDREKAAKEGRILPTNDPEYTQALKSVAEGEKELDQYLDEQQKKFKSQKISYFGTGKNRYQLEIPDELTKNLGSDYELKSKRKGFKRYQTPELEELIANLGQLEKQRDELTDDSTRQTFADFDARKNKWAQIVNQMAVFDCLSSLARYSSESSLHMCIPEFDFDSDQPYLEIRDGYHPSLASGSGMLASTASEYIPNDTALGGNSTAPVLLLTGANMGGKSTLMRQTAVLVVLAQIGSLVPAKKMRLTPVDRVFSRIGASDCIAAGQSTFYIELNETNVILREATHHSLVILGRGTATFDGTAIATAVLSNLAEKLKCRTLFSTHYHSLCTKFADNPSVTLGHMKCLVENDDINGDPSMDNITFLYTLANGVCPKSYGFFTARMAGIDVELVRRAYQASKMIESNGDECLKKLRKLTLAMRANQISDSELLTELDVN